MNVFETMSESKFSVNEQILIDLIRKDPVEFMDMDLQDICKRCYISKSTVYRLCDKLGADGLADLKVRISRDMATYLQSKEDFDYNYPVRFGDSERRIASVLKKDYEQTLLKTLNLMDFDDLHKAALAIERAERVDIYTSAGNIYFAENFRFQMMEINKTVTVPSEQYIMNLQAATSDKKHFSIVISFGGRALQIEEICRILKDRGSEILLICSNEADKLIPYADYILSLSPDENHYQKISSFSTRLSLLYILDTLYTCVFSIHYEENKQKKSAYYHEMNKFRK